MTLSPVLYGNKATKDGERILEKLVKKTRLTACDLQIVRVFSQHSAWHYDVVKPRESAKYF